MHMKRRITGGLRESWQRRGQRKKGRRLKKRKRKEKEEKERKGKSNSQRIRSGFCNIRPEIMIIRPKPTTVQSSEKKKHSSR